MKEVENCCFGKLFCGADISCQPPDVYASRFKRFIDRMLVEPGQEGERGGGVGVGVGVGVGEMSEATSSSTSWVMDGQKEGPVAARSLEVELAAVAK